MSNNSILENPKFWNILQYLVDLEGSVSFDKVCDYYKLTPQMLNSLLNFLHNVDFQITLNSNKGELMVIPPKEKPKFTLHFNLMEWLAFQAHFPLLSSASDKVYNDKLTAKLSIVEDQYNKNDLFAPLSVLDFVKDHSLSEGITPVEQKDQSKVIIEDLELALLENTPLNLMLKSGGELDIMPRKLVYIDGSLSLIAEDMKDLCLVQISTWNIVHVETVKKEYTNNFSSLEIIDFINSIRAISENEVRLILKVHDHSNVNLTPAHIHMNNPCIVTNSEGEKIWAASVEPCLQVFEWIFEMGKSVEIIDPGFLKKQYMDFCVDRLKKSS